MSHEKLVAMAHVLQTSPGADSQDIPKPSAAKMIRVQLPVFNGVLTLIQEHPDWDDETIANKADWRAQ